MNEWTIVTVVIALVGLVAAVVTPIIKLNTTITKLSAIVDNLAKSFDSLTNKNSEAHGKLWNKLDEHEDAINGHETRLQLIEKQR